MRLVMQSSRNHTRTAARQRAPRHGLVLLLLLLLAVLAACGGSPDLVEAENPPATGGGDSEAPAPRMVTVEVFFDDLDRGDIGEVFGVERQVAFPRVLRGAMTELLQGPTADEQAAGYTSWFSADTAGLLRSVEITDRVAHISFDATLPEIIPNASTSAGSAALLAALDATATQFPTVDAAIYSLEGDTAAFYQWLQLDPPR